jgi:pyruvate dehydrogenase (quinone)
MSGTVGDFMLERLSEWGVRRVYGYPGDGINGILGPFDRHENGLDFVQVAHEEVAAFMAASEPKGRRRARLRGRHDREVGGLRG